MVDPVTFTTTVITLATFIKDLIDIVESIHRSIEKVSENRRQIRELIEDVVCTLRDLENLTRENEGTFQGPDLLHTLENLKKEMMNVHSKCCKISSPRVPGFRGVGSQFKAWVKRDDLEKKITCLKEHVNKCFLQFTAFSAARIEHTSAQVACTTLRVEQRLIVNNVEGQVKLCRIEGMMAQLLLETEYGRNKMDETIQIISSDQTHESLEFQYLSVQTIQLIDSLQHLLTSGRLILHTPFWRQAEPFQLEFTQSAPLHVLHQVLGVAIKIKEGRNIPISLESIKAIVLHLGVPLLNIGLTSESIAWESLKIQIIHQLDHSAETSPGMAHALALLSIGYQKKLQFLPALQASQQSLDVWNHISESLPEVDNQIGHLTALTTHAQNLLETGKKMTALSTVQDALGLAHSIIEQLIKCKLGFSCLTEEEEVRAACSCDTHFILAKVLSSLDQHLESYKAAKEGFQTILKLPVFLHYSGNSIDFFLNQICKVAEEGRLSLDMLQDCAILFWNLTRIYPKHFSHQFLLLLHASTYFSQQASNSSDARPCMKDICVFLEPKLECVPPMLDITRPVQIDFDVIIEDAVWAFYSTPSEMTVALIQNIFVTHFDQAICVLRYLVEKSAFRANIHVIEWILYTLADVMVLVSNPNQVALLQVLTCTIGHFGTILVNQGSEWKWVPDKLLWPFSHQLWRAGLLEDALKVCEQVIKYLDSRSHTSSMTVIGDPGLWQLKKGFLLYHMGKFPIAIEMIQQTSAIIASPPEGFFLHPWILQAQLLRRIRQNHKALELIRAAVAVGCQKYWTDNDKVFNLQLYFLLAELATTWGLVGQPKRALKAAEQAVVTCRKDVGEAQKCVLIHALTTLSNCLAAVWRNNEALTIAQEAVSLYAQNAPHMWGNFLFTIRKQELGGNAFLALSLRLSTSGKAEQAWSNAEEATKLYRELVALAPRHLPILATSLRNLATLLWEAGRRDEALAACEEAVNLMRKAAGPETYFLPSLAEVLSELAFFLAENGHVDAADAASAECAEAQRKFALLAPQPEFLFQEVVTEVESDVEDIEGSNEARETASEDDDKLLDASELPEVVSEAARTLMLESPPVAAADEVIPDATVTPEPEAPVIPDEGTAVSIKTPFDILHKPLEVKLSLRSTPMDIVWWMVLGILVAIVWSRVI